MEDQAPKLSKLEIISTELSPPKIKFVVQIDGGPKAKIDEMWASVGVPKGYEVLDIVAGRLRGGLLKISGSDFEFDLVNPPQDSKIQRCRLKQRDGKSNVWEGTVHFPRVHLQDAVTPFSILLADTTARRAIRSKFV